MNQKVSATAMLRAMFRNSWRTLTGGYLLRICHQVCEALVPVASGWVIGNAVTTGDGHAILLGIGGILLLFAVLATAGGLGHYYTMKAALKQAHLLRVGAVRTILTNRAALTHRSGGELLAITSLDTRAATSVMEVVGRFVAALMGLGVAAVVLLRINLGLGVGVLAAVVALVAFTRMLGPYLEKRLQARQQSLGTAAASATDLLTGLRSLRGFGGIAEGDRRYRAASQASLGATLRAATSTAVVTSISGIATGVLVVVTAVTAARYTVNGVIGIGELVTVIGMAAFLMDPLGHITYAVRDLSVARASAQRVADVLGSSSKPAQLSATTHATKVGPLTGHNLGAVAGSEVNFELSPGQLMGVVGTNREHLDRFAQVLAGNVPPESGSLTYAGQELHTLDDDARADLVLAEPHAVFLLGGNLEAALTTTADEGDDSGVTHQMLQALDAATVSLSGLAGHRGSGALADIELLDHGANLSGGQRQRIALARALHTGRQLLILRDPTSAVDAVTEAEIARRLKDIRRNQGAQTILFTTSPLLLGVCDQVLFLGADQAHLGTHQQLVDEPTYREVVLR